MTDTLFCTACGKDSSPFEAACCKKMSPATLQNYSDKFDRACWYPRNMILLSKERVFMTTSRKFVTIPVEDGR